MREGTLDDFGVDLKLNFQDTGWQERYLAGQRVCPNPDCRAHIFVIYSQGQGIVVSYPPERIDFDASALPERVQEPLEEAIECHANECFRAAAVMVRRTLEAVCEDQGAEGDSLYARIESLGQKIVLPKGLVAALHDLRLLGNDAAHVEAREYENVGKREVEVAVEIAKMIIHATYQMDAILKGMKELKKPAVETEN